MRYLRLVIGALVVIGALYIIVAENVTGASSNAFVNAPIVTVRAPVAGDIELHPRTIGAEVSTETVLFSVNDIRADRVRLDDLVMELEKAQAEVARLESDKATYEDYRDQLDTQYAAYATERQRELGARGGISQSLPLLDLSDPEKLIGLSDAMPDTASETSENTAQTTTRGEQEPTEPVVTSLLSTQRDASEREIFLDGTSGAQWNYGYWRATAYRDLARVESELANAEAIVEAFAERVERERVRLIGLTGGDIASPVHGVVWDRLVGDGVNVQRGDPIMKVANCGAAVVSLSVSEIVYNRLSTGDPAIFRLSGTDHVMQGTVTRLAGAGAATVYENMAVAPSREHLQRFDVTLIVPELRTADMSSGCHIGRTGRVFFEDRPLDPLRRILN
ncbi:MAG: HlyD family efflux transporter periplasmic adaptor subunit [Pseudomonadota bacterium]|nr:HlyD family efflux transporter periplasmic adaptor subunit [Pseudomonadota bacterium]